MSTKKKQTKKFSQKVQKIVRTDIFRSLGIASILLNLLLLAIIIVFTSTDTFDRKLFISAQNSYCKNKSNISKRAEQLGSKKTAKREWQIDCLGHDFYPFYQEAVDKYDASINQSNDE